MQRQGMMFNRGTSNNRRFDMIAIYLWASLAIWGGFVAYTLLTVSDRFDAVHFLASSKLSQTLHINVMASIVVRVGQLLLRFTVGPLRDLEVEQLVESGKGYLLDMVLFLIIANPSIDDSDVGSEYLTFFLGTIFILKILHLIGQLRVSHLLESGTVSRRPIFRLLCLVVTCITLDCALLVHARSRSTAQSNFFLWIFFEALGLTISASASLCKLSVLYVDICIVQELHSPVGWVLKNEYIFLIDVLNDIMSLTTFLTFLVIFFLSRPTRLPIYLATDIIQVARTLMARIKSFHRYRSLTSQIETHLADASLEEIEAADTCIICRDILLLTSKKLQCGHIFHSECLKGWFVQHQSCPTCRTPVKPTTTTNTTNDTHQRSTRGEDSSPSPSSSDTVSPRSTGGPTSSSVGRPTVVVRRRSFLDRHHHGDDSHQHHHHHAFSSYPDEKIVSKVSYLHPGNWMKNVGSSRRGRPQSGSNRAASSSSSSSVKDDINGGVCSSSEEFEKLVEAVERVQNELLSLIE